MVKVKTEPRDLGATDLEALPPGAYKDTASNLTLRVSGITGARSLSVLFWHREQGRPVRLTLPPRGKRLMPIAEARRIAEDPEPRYSAARDRRAKDKAERQERKRDLAQQEEKRKAEAEANAKAEGPTVGSLAETWLAREEPRLRPTTYRGYARALRIIEAERDFAGKPAADLTRAHVAAFRDRVRERHKLRTANDVVAFLSTVLESAANVEDVKVNVIAGLKRLPGEESRDRYLSPDELRKVLHAATELGGSAGLAVLLALHTGTRLTETIQAPWSELDLASKVWRLPAARNKSKRDFVCPLSPGALAVLAKLKARSGTSPWVFPSPIWSDEPLATIQQPLRLLQERSGTTDWSFHDLRRTVRTVLGALRIPQEIAEACVNHAKDSLVATYNRHDPIDEKREAMKALSAHLKSLMRVVTLRSRRRA